MGAVIGKAADSLGGAVGNAVVAPFKFILTGSCEGVCSGPWDLICFIEHLCVSNLLKFFMILALSYITLLFFYLLFKLGICQCIIKSLCRMCCAACETYWFALEDMTCFLWHKLKNTKRVNRRRRCHRDIEAGSSSSESYSDNRHPSSAGRKRKSYRENRRSQSLRARHGRHHHIRVTSKTREMPMRVKVGSRRLKSSRQHQLSKMRHLSGISKRRKLR